MKLVDLYEAMVDVLYHTTSSQTALDIVQHGEIKPRTRERADWELAICLTRNRLLHYNDGCVKFVIDRQALRANYKIKPFDYMHSAMSAQEIKTDHGDSTPGVHKEQEERVYKPIPINSRLIKEVQIYKNNIFNSDMQVLPKFIELVNKLGIPVRLMKD